jgi:hypothetical protein
VTSALADELRIFIGDGLGGFQSQPPIDFPDNPTDVALGDLDGDDLLDAAVVLGESNEVAVLYGLGDGSFAEESRYRAGDGARSVGMADVNRDGRLDVIVGNDGSTHKGTTVLLGGQSEALLSFSTSETIGRPHDVAVGDFNEDGRADIAVASGDPYSSQDGVGVQLNLGEAGFGPTSLIVLGATATAVVTGDFNKDDHTDLAASANSELYVVLGQGDGTFGIPRAVTSGEGPDGLVVSDINADGNPDLVGACPGPDALVVLLGDGDGTCQAAPGVSVAADVDALAAGDLDLDGHEDLVVTGAWAYGIFVMLGNGAGAFSASGSLDTDGVLTADVGLADLDRDGKLDVVTVNSQTQDVSVFLGNGDGTFAAEARYAADSSASSLAIADVTFDVIAACDYEGVTAVVTNRGPLDAWLRFDSDKTQLVWGEVDGAQSYNLYRGDVATLADSDGDGLPDDGYGTCQSGSDPDVTDTVFVDSMVPAPASAWFYIVTHVGVDGEVGAGKTWDCTPREILAPCSP